MEALATLWAQAQAGIDCSYAHIVADGQALGAVTVGALTNVWTCLTSLVK